MTDSPQGSWDAPAPQAAPTPATPEAPAAPQASAQITPGSAAPIRPKALKPAVMPLRPLTFFELIEATFKALRANAKALFGISFLGMAVLGIVGIPIASLSWFSLSKDLADVSQMAGLDAAESNNPVVIVTQVIASFVFVFLLAWVLWSVYAMQALAVGQSVVDRKPTVKWLWRAFRPKLGNVALGVLIVTVVSFLAIGIFAALGALGVFALVETSNDIAGALVAFLFIAVFYIVLIVGSIAVSFSAPIIALENLGAVRSIGRSVKLFFGQFWRNLGVYLGLSLIVSAVSSVIATPIMMVFFIVFVGIGLAAPDNPDLIAALIIIGYGATLLVAYAITLPFTSAMTTVHYLDARMRQEGFDAELMATVARQQAAETQHGVPGTTPRTTPQSGWGQG